MFNCVFVTFLCGILGQVWYLIVSIPDLCHLETCLSPPVKYVYQPFQGGTSFVYHLCYLCLVLVMLSCLFIPALWSPAGKGQTSWLLFVMLNCVFVTFPCGILGQVCYLIVSIPDLCGLKKSYFLEHLLYVRLFSHSVIMFWWYIL